MEKSEGDGHGSRIYAPIVCQNRCMAIVIVADTIVLSMSPSPCLQEHLESHIHMHMIGDMLPAEGRKNYDHIQRARTKCFARGVWCVVVFP